MLHNKCDVGNDSILKIFSLNITFNDFFCNKTGLNILHFLTDYICTKVFTYKIKNIDDGKYYSKNYIHIF